ncbi:MAG TPA: ABC transporter ATP-binding protein, partial [Paenirhodobacter sp.]
EPPDAGRVVLAGADLTEAQPRDRNVAMIFDNLALYPDRTGFENIAYPLRLARRTQADIDERVRQIAVMLHIPHVLSRLPKTMSGGEKQRVALARALVRDPTVFLLDEPLSSLDAMLRIELRAELRRLQSEQGHTFVLATPDFQEALAVADRVVMLRGGKIVQIAGPQDLYDFPADIETARFVGTPQINLVDAVWTGATLDIAGHSFSPVGFRAPAPGAFVAGIRPEHLLMRPSQDGDFDAVVTDLEPLGHLVAATIRTGDTELRLTAAAEIAGQLLPGTTLGIALDGRGVLAFAPTTGRLMTSQD